MSPVVIAKSSFQFIGKHLTLVPQHDSSHYTLKRHFSFPKTKYHLSVDFLPTISGISETDK